MPALPYSVGKIVPISPSLPSSLMVTRGNSAGSSHFITLGAISRSAKSRTIFFKCSCSSESWKSKPGLRVPNVRRRPQRPPRTKPKQAIITHRMEGDEIANSNCLSPLRIDEGQQFVCAGRRTGFLVREHPPSVDQDLQLAHSMLHRGANSISG